MSHPYFHIDECDEEGRVRLSLAGELDRGSMPLLEDRLTRLRAKKRAVRLDLSKLEFIDSTGLRLLIRAVGDARTDGWQLQIEEALSPTVRRLFKLVHFEHFAAGADE